MLEAEPQSNLAITIERKTATDEGVEWRRRKLDVYYRDPSSANGVRHENLRIVPLAQTGDKVAIVPLYNQEQFDQLGVNAIITVDAQDLILTEPVIIERNTHKSPPRTEYTDGLMAQKIGEFVTVKKGRSLAFSPDTLTDFSPRKTKSLPIGAYPHNDTLRLTIKDISPKPATEVPSLEPAASRL